MAWDRQHYYDTDKEGPDITYFGVRTTKAARKEYRCCMCSGTIKIGERYERMNYVDHDDGGKFKSDPCHTTTGLCAYDTEGTA